MSTNNANTTPAGVRGILLADPKKTTALVMLAAVLAVVVFRAVSRGDGGGPARAGAAVSTSGRDMSKSSSPKALSEREAAFAIQLQKWSAEPVIPISRNLFAVRIEYFPMSGSRTTQSDAMDEGFWSRLEKSITMKADLKDRRENLIANYKDQATRLKLQSTVMGPEPKAMIEGKLVGEGDVVAGFRVLKIEARRIIVEREGIRLDIE